MRRSLCLFLMLFILCESVLGQDEVFSIKKPVMNTQEYFSGAYPGAVMMKVNLVGGVHRPGVYNVPINSELGSVISYAGGPIKEAEINEVLIRSKKGETYEVNKVDLNEFFSDAAEKPYKLRPDDYVYVKQTPDLVNNNVFRGTMVASAIISSILTILLIDRTLQR